MSARQTKFKRSGSKRYLMFILIYIVFGLRSFRFFYCRLLIINITETDAFIYKHGTTSIGYVGASLKNDSKDLYHSLAWCMLPS